jgi:hypothetical protein
MTLTKASAELALRFRALPVLIAPALVALVKILRVLPMAGVQFAALGKEAGQNVHRWRKPWLFHQLLSVLALLRRNVGRLLFLWRQVGDRGLALGILAPRNRLSHEFRAIYR